MAALDKFDRPLRDIRISVTDRCNLRCVYCMPKEVFGREFKFLDRGEILTFEELERLGRILVGLGVEKIRITGGEPLLRRDLAVLIGKLAAIDGLADITLTTNGSLLKKETAVRLREAGLNRITISLDSLDDEVFRRMNDVDFPVDVVLGAVDAALEAGLEPVKIDTVVRRGLNDDHLVELAGRFRGTGVTVRFIEYMDVGTTNGWRIDDVVPAAEVLRQISAKWPIEPVEPAYFGEVADRWRYVDGAGEIGFITSVSQPFCGSCTRLRLSAEGKLYTCLFGATGFDVRAPLRAGVPDETLHQIIASIWSRREDRYSEVRSAATEPMERVEMSRIGG
jgi:cyclic pyranopterin phosphate synthase